MGNSSASIKSPTDIDSFRKKYKKAAISNSITQVKDGVCHGMCLNWVRKMIIKPEWTPNRNKNYESKGAKLHYGYQDGAKANLQKGFGELQSAVSKASSHNDRMQELYIKDQAGSINPLERTELKELIEQTKAGKEEFNLLKATMFERKSKLDHLLKAEGGWTTEYAQYFQEFKDMGNQKFKALDATFIESMGMVGMTDVERFPGYFAAISSCIRTMKSGQAGLLNICKKAGSGHFVAFHKSKEGEDCNFYDPNLGWYRSSSVEGICQLFEDLFISVYANSKYDEANWIEVTQA